MEPIERVRVPEVFQALDAVDWLAAWWRWWREQRRSHTQKRFAREAGVAVGALPSVLGRRYLPSRSTIDAFNRVLCLDPPRLMCLQTLFDVARAHSPEAHAEALASHQALVRAWEDGSRPAVPARYAHDWENVVLREAARRRPLPDDPARLAQAFRAPPDPDAVREALAWLVSSGLLVPAPGGGWTADRSAIDGGETADGVRETYRRALTGALDSIASVPPSERELALLVLSLRRADLAAVRRQLYAFMRSVRDFADAGSDPEVVYQLAVQVVPVFELGGLGRDGR